MYKLGLPKVEKFLENCEFTEYHAILSEKSELWEKRIITFLVFYSVAEMAFN